MTPEQYSMTMVIIESELPQGKRPTREEIEELLW